MFKARPQKYLRYLVPGVLFGTHRTKQILTSNPVTLQRRTEATELVISVYNYNLERIEEKRFDTIEETFQYKGNNDVTWINIDGIRKNDVENVGHHFGIHPLIIEDIISIGQRPKMDEADDILYC
ncbi:MAG TPA: hypothetical protein VM888_12915, partial [Chitinophagaceae bacterium]|nr:hypothetical protein [Chitinophagaceae bacterium]